MTAGLRSAVPESPTTARVGIVIIGRNEGDRLLRCLDAIDRALPAVYVDSGSGDGSPDHARRLGIDVVELDAASPFTAARARNAGSDHLARAMPDLDYVQMIDGDCTVEPGWIDAAAEAMRARPMAAAVFGRRRERFPDRSVYNWLCDVEWAVPPGPAHAFGGDVLLRRSALAAAGGYREMMIAGEDPDLSARLRGSGWEILCLDRPMTVHDAAIDRFGSWWRRTVRSGHAFAELADLHHGGAGRDYRRSCRRILFWGGIVPLAAVAGLALQRALFAAAILLTLAQFVRLTVREMRRRPARRAIALAAFLVLGKYAEMTGIARYHVGRLLGRTAPLIEYKQRSAR